MRFRVFGFPTQVEMSFWIMAFLIGALSSGGKPHMIAIWVAVVFVSILFHELGHAFAMQRHGMRPSIKLYMMGGMASAPRSPRLSRGQRIFISFAGPLAGFVFGGLVYGMTRLQPSLTQLTAGASTGEIAVAATVRALLFVNVGWGLINLVPVLPLDGGHIFEAAVGPGNRRRAIVASIVVGGGIALTCLIFRDYVEQYLDATFMAVMFGSLAFQNYRRLRAMPVIKPVAGTQRRFAIAPKQAPPDTIPPQVVKQLKHARQALADEHYYEASVVAGLIIHPQHEVAPSVRQEALHIMGWAHLLDGNPQEAMLAIKRIAAQGAEPDAALVAGTLLALGELEAAREVAEAARRHGDDRKELVATLIQVLIRQGHVARAAAVALDISEELSDDDIEQMATLAFEHDSYPWASRLNEVLFKRSHNPDHAYAAARGRALEGDTQGAIKLLKKAVAAGFKDASQAWSDQALAPLRDGDAADELALLLPRPSPSE